MFAVILRRRGLLWQLTAFYKDRHGQTVVSSSWHRDRADAVREAKYF